MFAYLLIIGCLSIGVLTWRFYLWCEPRLRMPNWLSEVMPLRGRWLARWASGVVSFAAAFCITYFALSLLARGFMPENAGMAGGFVLVATTAAFVYRGVR